MSKKLNKLFQKSKKIMISDNTKIVIMSDCHRGSGDSYDTFLHNKHIYEAALRHYFDLGFTYIELGDGDDMWEVKNYKDIIEEHINTFKLLKEFHKSDRLIMIYGNHDMCKKSKKVLKDTFYKYYDKTTKKEEPLLDDIDVRESLVLLYKKYEIFLIHGHQVDFLNNNLWLFSRFLVRHIWRPLERLGIKDPTSAAKNYQVSNKKEKKLEKWSIDNNKILISGHTHRPIFPKIGKSLYFNDGSCVHPNGITCIEIEAGGITLVKWLYHLDNNKAISVRRVVLEGKESIVTFFT